MATSGPNTPATLQRPSSSSPGAAKPAPAPKKGMPTWAKWVTAVAVVVVLALALGLGLGLGLRSDGGGSSTNPQPPPADAPRFLRMERIDNSPPVAPTTYTWRVTCSTPVTASTLDLRNGAAVASWGFGLPKGPATVVFTAPIALGNTLTFSGDVSTGGSVVPYIGPGNNARNADTGTPAVAVPEQGWTDMSLLPIETFPPGTPAFVSFARTDTNPLVPGVVLTYAIEWNVAVNVATLTVENEVTTTPVTVGAPATVGTTTTFDVTVPNAGVVRLVVPAGRQTVTAVDGGLALPESASARADELTILNVVTPSYVSLTRVLADTPSPLFLGMRVYYDVKFNTAVSINSLNWESGGSGVIEFETTYTDLGSNRYRFRGKVTTAGDFDVNIAAGSAVTSVAGSVPLPNGAVVSSKVAFTARVLTPVVSSQQILTDTRVTTKRNFTGGVQDPGASRPAAYVFFQDDGTSQEGRVAVATDMASSFGNEQKWSLAGSGVAGEGPVLLGVPGTGFRTLYSQVDTGGALNYSFTEGDANASPIPGFNGTLQRGGSVSPVDQRVYGCVLAGGGAGLAVQRSGAALGGGTWSDNPLIPNAPQSTTAMRALADPKQGARVHALFENLTDGRIWYRVSDDGGATWGSEVEVLASRTGTGFAAVFVDSYLYVFYQTTTPAAVQMIRSLAQSPSPVTTFSSPSQVAGLAPGTAGDFFSISATRLGLPVVFTQVAATRTVFVAAMTAIDDANPGASAEYSVGSRALGATTGNTLMSDAFHDMDGAYVFGRTATGSGTTTYTVTCPSAAPP